MAVLDRPPVLAARADLLVWLDLPFRVTLARVIRRTVPGLEARYPQFVVVRLRSQREAADWLGRL